MSSRREKQKTIYRKDFTEKPLSQCYALPALTERSLLSLRDISPFHGESPLSGEPILCGHGTPCPYHGIAFAEADSYRVISPLPPCMVIFLSVPATETVKVLSVSPLSMVMVLPLRVAVSVSTRFALVS